MHGLGTLFRWIEKLSGKFRVSPVLRERLLFSEDQRTALEKALLECEARTKDALSQKQHFELENLGLKEKVQALEEKLAKNYHARLDADKETLLILLATDDGCDEGAIVEASEFSAQRVKLYLDDLKAARFVTRAGFATPTWEGASASTTWMLTQKGRQYLAEHGLLA